MGRKGADPEEKSDKRTTDHIKNPEEAFGAEGPRIETDKTEEHIKIDLAKEEMKDKQEIVFSPSDWLHVQGKGAKQVLVAVNHAELLDFMGKRKDISQARYFRMAIDEEDLGTYRRHQGTMVAIGKKGDVYVAPVTADRLEFLKQNDFQERDGYVPFSSGALPFTPEKYFYDNDPSSMILGWRLDANSPEERRKLRKYQEDNK